MIHAINHRNDASLNVVFSARKKPLTRQWMFTPSLSDITLQPFSTEQIALLNSAEQKKASDYRNLSHSDRVAQLGTKNAGITQVRVNGRPEYFGPSAESEKALAERRNSLRYSLPEFSESLVQNINRFIAPQNPLMQRPDGHVLLNARRLVASLGVEGTSRVLSNLYARLTGRPVNSYSPSTHPFIERHQIMHSHTHDLENEPDTTIMLGMVGKPLIESHSFTPAICHVNASESEAIPLAPQARYFSRKPIARFLIADDRRYRHGGVRQGYPKPMSDFDYCANHLKKIFNTQQWIQLLAPYSDDVTVVQERQLMSDIERFSFKSAFVWKNRSQ